MTYLAITTLARVKSVLKIDTTDTAADARITEIIRAVSFGFEKFTDRKLMLEARTEEHDVPHKSTRRFWLGAGPITAIASVKNDSHWNWVDTSALDADDYHFDAVSLSPILLLDVGLEAGTKALQVVYTAGLADSTEGTGDGLVFTYPDVVFGADIQCAEEWRRKNDPSAQSVTAAGAGSRTWIEAHELLPRVQQLWNPYRVMALL